MFNNLKKWICINLVKKIMFGGKWIIEDEKNAVSYFWRKLILPYLKYT